MKKKRHIGRIILISLFVLVLALNAYVLYCNFTGQIAFLGKYAMVRVITNSMEPEIPAGSFILAERVSAAEIAQDNVILFYSDDPDIYGKINTHRVIEITQTATGPQFTTKGDNALQQDKYKVSQDKLVGRYVTTLSDVSKLLGLLQTPWLFAVLIILLAAIPFVISFVDIIKKGKGIKMDELVQQEVERLKQMDATSEKVQEDTHYVKPRHSKDEDTQAEKNDKKDRS